MRRDCFWGSRACTPGCWLEVSMHLKTAATSQLDQEFSVVFMCRRTDADLVPKFHVALQASHAALPTSTYSFSSSVDPSQS
jgi:hypothetical protein